MDNSCRVCGWRHTGEIHEAREMMHGVRTRFHYAQCAECGSLWITDPPADFTPYYSNSYYSFADAGHGITGQIKSYLRAKRDAAYFNTGGVVGPFLRRHFEDGSLLSLSKLGVSRGARILDVGCGRGKLLYRMAAVGFTNLSGVDPFLPEETSNRNGVKIRRAHLETVEDGKYDLIMFQHSLEHVATPGATLKAAAGLLSAGGKCLVRLPLVSEAWEQYGTNWVQLDPPRHLWIPTEKSMKLLAEFVGLKVEITDYDSTAFQFWGSELYQRDIPLNSINPCSLKGRLRFKKSNEWRLRAESLNREGRGDQAAFILSKQTRLT